MRGAGWGVPACSAVLLAVTLTGCDGAPMPVPSPAYTSTYAPAPPVVLAPLTGEVRAEGAVAGPSLAAKIDNHRDARPQVGLEHTDLVFEELVEGGLTRYVAVWQSDVPAEIGPIRSIRPMDPDIITPLGGIVAYSGGQSRFVQAMKATGVYNAIHGQPDTADVMYRTDAKRAPHNVIVRAPQLIARHADLAPPAQQFAFAPDLAGSTAVREGSAATRILLAFSSSSQPSWDFHAESGLYLRAQSGQPDLDSGGAALSAANVIVLQVAVGDDGGVPKTELIGSGAAWVSSGGRTVPATWQKGSTSAAIRLVDATGTVVRLAPGNSWIELVPTSGAESFQP